MNRRSVRRSEVSDQYGLGTTSSKALDALLETRVAGRTLREHVFQSAHSIFGWRDRVPMNEPPLAPVDSLDSGQILEAGHKALRQLMSAGRDRVVYREGRVQVLRPGDAGYMDKTDVPGSRQQTDSGDKAITPD